MATEIEVLKQIKIAYNNDLCYFEGELNSEPFKIRMNKDHARNGRRNDDMCVHNLSLISVKCPEGVGMRKVGAYLQMQVDNIRDWEDAEEQILEFFYLIEDK